MYLAKNLNIGTKQFEILSYYTKYKFADIDMYLNKLFLINIYQ